MRFNQFFVFERQQLKTWIPRLFRIKMLLSDHSCRIIICHICFLRHFWKALNEFLVPRDADCILWWPVTRLYLIKFEIHTHRDSAPDVWFYLVTRHKGVVHCCMITRPGCHVWCDEFMRDQSLWGARWTPPCTEYSCMKTTFHPFFRT